MCVDHFIHWPEAIPLTNITTEGIDHTFLSEWIAHFMVPITLTSDPGSLSESGLWSQHMAFFGIPRMRTTSYHPCANGMVERFHHQLKAALIVHASNTWLLDLPLVLLGIHASLKVDLKYAKAELVYGTTLHLLGDSFLSFNSSATKIPDPLSSE